MNTKRYLLLILLISWQSCKVAFQLNDVLPFSKDEVNYQKDPNMIKSLTSLNSSQLRNKKEYFSTNTAIPSKAFYNEKFRSYISNFKRNYNILHNDKQDEASILAFHTKYTVVKIKGGKRKARRVLKKHGYNKMIQVFPCDDYYLVENIDKKSRFKRDINRIREENNEILRILPQKHFIRYRRDNSEDFMAKNNRKRNIHLDREEMDFNDPYYKDQWYLHYYNWHHLNIQTVWKAGYTGQGVTVSILDDGVHPDNPDLGINYDPSISYDYVHFKEADESSVEINSHGTSCAGVIAAIANNSLCGVGIAYNARIGGCRVLDGPMTDAQEAMSLVHAIDKVDIYSASWGPRDDGKHMSKPGILARRAFFKGVTDGRNEKGSIYVWAAGNGGKYDDNCNMDGYASNIYTIAIGALSHYGKTTYYTETCPATLASTYVGGSHAKPMLETLALIKNMTKVIVPGDHGNCRKNFQGTSAAAPMAAGLIALLLEANPELTWRDVQYIIIKSATIPNINEGGWKMNAAGYHYHNKVGFGVMDCGRMISIGQKWIPVAPQKMLRIMERKRRYIQGDITTAAISVENEHIRDGDHINSLEYVIATLSISHPRRGNLQIYLISPSNTVSQLLSERPYDHSKNGFHKWKFKTVHFWGENPTGNWLLQIHDSDPTAHKRYNKFIDFFSLKFYGTSGKSNNRIIRDPQFENSNLDKQSLSSILKNELFLSRSVDIETLSNSSKINKLSSNLKNYSKCLD